MCMICKDIALGRLTKDDALIELNELVKAEGEDAHIKELREALLDALVHEVFKTLYKPM